MSNDEILTLCNYIKSHKPGTDIFETVNKALNALGYSAKACTKGELAGNDDWLLPEDQRYLFAGIKGSGWKEGFTVSNILLIKSAFEYSIEHQAEIYEENDIDKLNELSNKYDNIYADDYSKYIANDFIDFQAKFDQNEDEYKDIYNKTR